MAEEVAIDTDVLLKAAAYRVATDLVGLLRLTGVPAVLGLTHLIADSQLKRQRGLRDLEGARAEVRKVLAVLARIEPNEGEIALAADLAAEAQMRGLAFDTGEAQLAAIVACRQLPLFATGDKRALDALANLVTVSSIRSALVGRLVCFEQIIVALTAQIGEFEMRSRVCAEPNIDGAMRLACSCGRDPWDPAQLFEACKSFAADVRKQVGDLLIETSLLA